MNLEKTIRRILTANKAARANDRLLMLEVWRSQDLELTPQQEQKFMQVSSSESIRRTRQRLNEQGQLLPDTSTQKYRKRKAVEVREQVREEKAPMLFSMRASNKTTHDVFMET